VLYREGQVLLTYQAAPHYEYQLPGGGVDPGEHPIAALHREVYEETGWRISTPKRLGVFRRFVLMPEYDLWAEKICTLYLARPTTRLGPPSEDDHTALFASPEFAFAKIANDGDKYFLAQALGL